MIRISRREGEAIILFANDPTTSACLGKNKVELWIKKIHGQGNTRIELAISAPKEVPVLRNEVSASKKIT